MRGNRSVLILSDLKQSREEVLKTSRITPFIFQVVDVGTVSNSKGGASEVGGTQLMYAPPKTFEMLDHTSAE